MPYCAGQEPHLQVPSRYVYLSLSVGRGFTNANADLYGTSFYHSHYSAQYTGGIIGAMIIYGPHDNVDYDEDLGPVILEDWYHEDYYDLVEQVMAPASEGLLPPESTNNLINGKMNVWQPFPLFTQQDQTNDGYSILASTQLACRVPRTLASPNSSSNPGKPTAFV